MDDKYLDDCLEKIRNRTPKQIEEDMNWFYENYTKKEETVRTKEYADWLSNFLVRYEQIDDDCDAYHNFVYQIDQDNFELISWFASYIDKLAEEQTIRNIPDEDNEFEAYNYYFKIGNKYFHTSTMIGQGSITFMEKVDTEPNRKCVVVPLESENKNVS